MYADSSLLLLGSSKTSPISLTDMDKEIEALESKKGKIRAAQAGDHAGIINLENEVGVRYGETRL